jgi:galacturonosyltransferase
MKKVLIIGNNDVGLYNFRKELIEKLITDGFLVDFTVPYGEKVELLKKMGAAYSPIEINRRGTTIKEDYIVYKQYKALISRVKPDIILTYTIKPNIYGGLAGKQLHIPCIATITGLGTALQGSGWKIRLVKLLYKYGISRNRMVFFQNEDNREFLLKYGMVDEKRAAVVSGSGVNTEYFAPETIPHTSVNFLFIARLMREKGIEEYLEAAKVIKKKHDNVEFQLLGYYDEDYYKKQVEDLVSEGIVEYLGISGDTRTEMAMADCIVLPSYHEGMSNVLLEGAAFGLPLITTNISGCREAVEDGVTGFLCEKQDALSLTGAIEKFLKLDHSQRTEMGRKGREKMIREFDRKLVVGKYIDCIKSVLE